MEDTNRRLLCLRKQGTSSDHWIDAFYNWLEAQGLTRKAGKPDHAH
jgi:hypothetical protein